MRDLEVDLVDALNVPSDYPHSEYVQSWRPQVTPIDLGEVPENLRGNYNTLDDSVWACQNLTTWGPTPLPTPRPSMSAVPNSVHAGA